MSKDRFTDDTDEDEIMDAAPQGNDPEEEDAAEAPRVASAPCLLT